MLSISGFDIGMQVKKESDEDVTYQEKEHPQDRVKKGDDCSLAAGTGPEICNE